MPPYASKSEPHPLDPLTIDEVQTAIQTLQNDIRCAANDVKFRVIDLADFPVMPVEKFVMSLKPANFFEHNASNDVPRSSQSVNKSTLHTADQKSCCRPSLEHPSSQDVLVKHSNTGTANCLTMLVARGSVRRISPSARPLQPPRPPSSHVPRSRPFTNKFPLLLVSPPLTRPQLPFLSPTSSSRALPPLSTHLRQHFARLISTETRDYYKRRLGRGLRIGLTFYAILLLFHLIKLGIYQETIEHKWPTPPEWSLKSRWCLRTAQALQHPEEIGKLITDWPLVYGYLLELLGRLEDTEGEGKGICEQGDGGFLVEGVGKTGFDISDKSEPWRRGYFQALMGLARAAENLEGWVTDWKLHISAPAEYVVGPSNPRPKPLPPGRKGVVLREEDCEPAAESPEVFYMKILTTKGFDTRQRLDAALAYADWLDFKGLPDTAKDMYNWAMDIAAAGLPFDAARVVDKNSGMLKNGKDVPSENVLRVSNALAVHYAKCGDLSKALSIFTSILKTRRELPPPPPGAVPRKVSKPKATPFDAAFDWVNNVLIPVEYPPPAPSGNEPPVRNRASACEEAGLMAYIGEIIYASSSKDTGLAWTRDAVDLAETTLIDVNDTTDREAKERCAQCLQVGLDNWKTMVQSLVAKATREEQDSIEKAKTAWFGGERTARNKSQERKRWEAEKMIVDDRIRQSRWLLEMVITISVFLGMLCASRIWDGTIWVCSVLVVSWILSSYNIVHSAVPISSIDKSIAPAKLSSLRRRDTCESGGVDKDEYDLALHVAALFIILFVSTLGCAFPILAVKFPGLKIPARFFFAVRHFGTGVLIATAFVHLLPTAFISLGDPCLDSFWNEDYPAMPGAIALAAIFFVTVIEMIFHPSRRHRSIDHPSYSAGQTPSSGGHGCMGSAHILNHRDMGPLHGRSSSIGRRLSTVASPNEPPEDSIIDDERVNSQPQPKHDFDDGTNPQALQIPPTLTPEQQQRKELMQCVLLEFGILFHSVFIGMALSVSIGSDFVVLLIAIIFHQTFEGLALGSRIAAVKWPSDRLQPWFMALAYGCTPDSEVGLIVVGIMNAISAGLLTFASLVELLSEDFLSDESWRFLWGRQRVYACLLVFLGAFFMSLVGAWA
ncbi:conserved hypothetical protein [Paecilomyces variotii No. 5]|uniref:Uncharacterized protein n=1 Tax=Byssochlamys spectabilis (strain No. 5 / NBRC 109023) TaxID=1356009 RepID=V5HS46_BYSSN|nr:conserved hypothetical protein [Paecilomyces variotii No. 5]